MQEVLQEASVPWNGFLKIQFKHWQWKLWRGQGRRLQWNEWECCQDRWVELNRSDSLSNSILYSALVFKSFSIRKKTKTADSLKFFWYLCIDTGNSKIYQWKRIIRIFHHSLVVGSCSLDQVWVYLDEVSFPVLYPRRSSHCSHAGENVEHPVYGRFQQKTDTNQN